MTDYLWDIGALVAATGGRAIGSMPQGVTGLSIDTRTVKPGDAFFAIKGDRFDGHSFLTAAVAAGASVLVVSEKKLPALGRVHGNFIVVEDVLTALVRLSTAARARSKAKIIAVTGSVGKTTTKEALRHALSAVGSVHASAASFNNHWGVPLSLARMPADSRYGVFEIGMNHPDEIRPLVKIVRPHVAIVTLVAPAHLGHFADIGEIAKAKGEIFEGLVMGGTAVVNADDPQGPALTEMAREAGVDDIRTFGASEGADYRLLDFKPQPDGARMLARIGEAEFGVEMAASGRHIADNLLAVLGAAHIVGADVGAVASALSTWRTGKGRGERHRLALGAGSITLIDESYNANPTSMRAAVALLADASPAEGGRRIAVLGDMLELGDKAEALHADLASVLTEAGIDRVYLVGEEMKALDDALDGSLAAEWHENLDELQASLLGHLRAGDVVMVKGSNGIGLSRIVDRLVSAQGAAPTGPADGAGPSSQRTGAV
ncbi:UDP-N-acetylmuramoylalanyl-D-glutamyl-2, 6-diaminopimelate--D-alanyl-D-alanine ligase [Aureimonas sp. Leaf454]|uniref:UDP-N-acetylmuramoylalanyl-D-glutamyl-2, 6-diaminopimelate--D-alanyl-D-alanine ligase n=1 Tax=Aureimonas sp. Leaf454 TaxID=1736381 RepID=UPI00070213A7|nr:UDP-N-acetylmuramoylalanyl-D-glutamyl-2,6-diaminopimelate--D-alanyl-D-alanine ligase [Aureimonas sp. Leaf454]KQT50906.1 UDP-N-acetylmuramoylalanyl-D-glutamyl-2, 6-diaminopimelate--D-alanyl-D-alanine ligase [Aureimonas sp. Leaf454]